MSIRCDIGLFDANPSIDHQSVASTRQVIYGPSITDGHRLTGHRHRLAQVMSIYRQSIGDQLVTNLGTRVLWRPTEVSPRRTNRTALGLSNRSQQRNDSPNRSQSSANMMPIRCKSDQHTANPGPIGQSTSATHEPIHQRNADPPIFDQNTEYSSTQTLNHPLRTSTSWISTPWQCIDTGYANRIP